MTCLHAQYVQVVLVIIPFILVFTKPQFIVPFITSLVAGYLLKNREGKSLVTFAAKVVNFWQCQSDPEQNHVYMEHL